MNGPPYAANAIHVTNNQITNNSQWAIFEDTVVVGHGLTETLNNLYMGNDLEANGGGYLSDPVPWNRHRSKLLRGVTAPGGAWHCLNGGSGYRAYGPVVRDNYFTT